MRSRAFLAASCLLASSCGERAPALVLHITSSLEISLETNTLFVRVHEPDGTSTERTYGLGEPPRDDWPQVLPIVGASGGGERTLRIEAELRNSRPGVPSVAVGYGELEATLPASGERSIALDVPRACIDADGDGYGNGFGCILPDCDDTRADIPSQVFCPGPPPPDDAGVADAGEATPDGGANPPVDGGVPADAATGCTMEGSGVGCAADELCINARCRKRCQNNNDCPDISQGCLPQVGVCICRVPCQNGTQCGPFACVDGCCRL